MILAFVIEEKRLLVALDGQDITPRIVKAAETVVYAAGRLALWAGRNYRKGASPPPPARPPAPNTVPPKGGGD